MSPIRVPVHSFDQPAGAFLLTVMTAKEVVQIANASPRYYDRDSMTTRGGIQRLLSETRVAEIAAYARTTDAAFPTPIILALAPKTYTLTPDGFIEIPEESKADIVDGQHRVWGLKNSGVEGNFTLPVVLILDALDDQKALLFATVNGKQTKVPASLIYDLFGVTNTRSPQKTSHEIARAINQSEESAWHGRLKMLGRKTPGSEETLSQGTFVNELLPLISSDPMGDRDAIRRGLETPVHSKCVFNEYFVAKKDVVILKVLMNTFAAARNTWPAEWDNPSASILTKSVGFTAIMGALPDLVEIGKKQNLLSLEYFSGVFMAAKRRLEESGRLLTSDHFSSGGGATNLRKIILGQGEGAA